MFVRVGPHLARQGFEDNAGPIALTPISTRRRVPDSYLRLTADPSHEHPMDRVVSLGSINVDRLHRVDESTVQELDDRYEWFPGPGETVAVEDVPAEFEQPDEIRHGGKGANQAVAAAHAGADTAMFGLVGTDHTEYGVLSELESTGVETNRIGVEGAPTGTADIFLTPDGENRIAIRAGANGEIDAEYVDANLDAIREADCLLLQNEIPVDPVVHLLDRLRADPERPTILLDPAPPRGIEPLLAAPVVDYVTPNEHEYRTIRPNLDEFAGVVVRKRGGDDVIVENGRDFRVPPPTVDVVDTTGAGDVLNGYLAAELASGTALRAALETATVAAAMATRSSGARNGIPDRAAVKSFRESR